MNTLEQAREATPSLVLRATGSAYAVLVGPWIAILALGVVATLRAPASGALVGVGLVAVVAALWTVWLGGFRVTLTNDRLTYRDGGYSTNTLQRAEIEGAKYEWLTFARIGRAVRAPRLVIRSRSSGIQISVNVKVFSRSDLRVLEYELGVKRD